MRLSTGPLWTTRRRSIWCISRNRGNSKKQRWSSRSLKWGMKGTIHTGSLRAKTRSLSSKAWSPSLIPRTSAMVSILRRSITAKKSAVQIAKQICRRITSQALRQAAPKLRALDWKPFSRSKQHAKGVSHRAERISRLNQHQLLLQSSC